MSVIILCVKSETSSGWAGCCGIIGNVSWRGQDGAELEGEVSDLPVDLRSNPHLWSWELGNGWEGEVANICGIYNICFLQWVKSQLRWYRLLLLEAHPPRGSPSIHWWDYISHLAYELLGIFKQELESVAEEKDICSDCWVCCHCDAISFRWMDGWKVILFLLYRFQI